MLLKLLKLSIWTRLRRFHAQLEQPLQAQQDAWRRICRGGHGTQFGREHGFSSLQTIDDYRKAVPVRCYRGFLPYIDRIKDGQCDILTTDPVQMFGVTSGSSDTPKFIPVTRSFTCEAHYSHLIWMYYMLYDHAPNSVGAAFSMVSPAVEGYTDGGVPYGSSSGKQYREQSIPIRMFHPVIPEVFHIRDCATKYYVILLVLMGRDLRVLTSVNPSTLVILGNVLQQRAEELLEDLSAGTLQHAGEVAPEIRQAVLRKIKPHKEKAQKLRAILNAEGCLLPAHVWPSLAIINTWQGGNAPFYLPQVHHLWGGASQRCLGLRATEGLFSVPLEDGTASAPLAVGSHFLEFIPEETDLKNGFPDTLLAHELETGKRYRMIISTSAGLYRYDLGDIVEVGGFYKKTPKIEFLHKAGGVLSVTGEKVCEEQVVKAMTACLKEYPCVTGFTVTLQLCGTPCYVLAVELGIADKETFSLQPLAEMFDRELGNINMEYRCKRQSRRLGDVLPMRMAAGTYQQYRHKLVQKGRPDGQIKPPHIVRPAGEGNVPVVGCPFFDGVKFITDCE